MYTHEEINEIIKESDQFEQDLADLIQAAEEAVAGLNRHLHDSEQHIPRVSAARDVLELALRNIGRKGER